MKQANKNIVYLTAIALNLVAAPALALDLGIMADITYQDSSEKDTPGGFGLGQFDMFASEQIGEHDRAFAEFVFEDADGFVIDLERIWIEHEFNQGFKVLAGRYHTPLGFWNRNYHHGSLLHLTTARPDFLDFEDGPGAILPTHLIGMMASGSFFTQAMELGYELGIGNGGSINTDVGWGAREIEMNNTADVDDAKAVVLHVAVTPEAFPLQVGLSAMYNTIVESGSGASFDSMTPRGGTLLDQTILGVDLRFEGDALGVLVEFYSFTHDNKTGSASTNSAMAYFVQLDYRVSDSFTPGYRYESVSFDSDDAYFTTLLSRKESIHHQFVLRYDVDDSNAIKFEVSRQNAKDKPDSDTIFTVQWAFMIP